MYQHSLPEVFITIAYNHVGLNAKLYFEVVNLSHSLSPFPLQGEGGISYIREAKPLFNSLLILPFQIGGKILERSKAPLSSSVPFPY